MDALELSDVGEIVRLVASAGDPTIEMSLPERKRALLEGVAQLIGADAWIWSTSVPNPEVEGDVMTTCFIDGGWRSGQEQAAVYQVLTGSEMIQQAALPIVQAARENRYVTFTRADLIPDPQWETVGAVWRQAGFDYLLLTAYPLGNGIYSGLGFHRHLGKPDFSARERAIVHVVFQQVDWLHRHGTNEQANERVVQLTPRERQVLVFLLTGDSKKRIAEELGLSEHTVNDYMKSLHKQFVVNSRAELQALFMHGGHKRPEA